MISTNNSFVTAQQTAANIANSTVARIRTLEQIRPLIDKNYDKERSNSINGNFQPKNAQKLLEKSQQPPGNKDSQTRLTKLGGNPSTKPINRVVAMIGKNSQSLSQDRTTAASSGQHQSLQVSSRGIKSNYLTNNLNQNADKINPRSSFIGSSN